MDDPFIAECRPNTFTLHSLKLIIILELHGATLLNYTQQYKLQCTFFFRGEIELNKIKVEALHNFTSYRALISGYAKLPSRTPIWGIGYMYNYADHRRIKFNTGLKRRTIVIIIVSPKLHYFGIC